MQPDQITSPALRDPLVSRILRALAVFLAVSGIAAVLSFAAEVIAYPYYITLYRQRLPSEAALFFMARWLRPTMSVMLIVGGIGLFRWRKWSIPILRTWAVASLTLSITNSVLYVWSNAQVRSIATTRSAPPPLALIGTTSLLNIVANAAFPLLVFYLISQPEVKEMWSTRSGGFEVVPFASQASTDRRD